MRDLRTSIVLFVLVTLAGCKGDYPKVFGLDWKENAATSPSGERDQRSYEFTEDSVISRRTCGTTVVSVASPAGGETILLTGFEFSLSLSLSFPVLLLVRESHAPSPFHLVHWRGWFLAEGGQRSRCRCG